MPDLASILQQGVANPWIYLPIAAILGALHALEPGHSKSLMAAFIIAIRGTPAQAVLLGASAAVGHTIIVFGLAALGLWFGDRLIAEKAEPWLELASGLLVVALAARLLWSAWPRSGGAAHGHDHDHSHTHSHGHSHSHEHAHAHGHAHGGHARGAHAHGFHEAAGHAHRHGPHEHHHHQDDEDAHAAAHAREIEARFAGRRNVSTGEIVWFGFTGGLLPCPAAIAVLLICLQLRAFALGLGMVAAFSFGLAVTLVAVGLVAAWGTKRAADRLEGARFAHLARWLPLVSGGLVLALGLAFIARGMGALLSA